MLSTDEVAFYHKNGYLVLPNKFDIDEMKLLLSESQNLTQMDIPQRVLERDDVTVRSVYAVHQHSDAFAKFTEDIRCLGPAQILLDSDVYIHQTQLNPKAPFVGDIWEWHQDYLYWAIEDLMPTPRVLNVAVFLDEVTEFNGPIFVMPGSHKALLEGETNSRVDGWQSTLIADFRHKITPEGLARMADSLGLESIKGAPGTVCVFDGQLLHCSPPNLSGHLRTIIFIRYNSILNKLRPMENPRPEWLACRDPQTLSPLPHRFSESGRS